MSEIVDSKEIIKKAKKELCCSSRTLSRLIACNICSVYNYEKGLTKPRYPRTMKRAMALLKLCEVLRENPDYLVEIFNLKDIDLIY